MTITTQGDTPRREKKQDITSIFYNQMFMKIDEYKNFWFNEKKTTNLSHGAKLIQSIEKGSGEDVAAKSKNCSPSS